MDDNNRGGAREDEKQRERQRKKREKEERESELREFIGARDLQIDREQEIIKDSDRKIENIQERLRKSVEDAGFFNDIDDIVDRLSSVAPSQVSRTIDALFDGGKEVREELGKIENAAEDLAAANFERREASANLETFVDTRRDALEELSELTGKKNNEGSGGITDAEEKEFGGPAEDFKDSNGLLPVVLDLDRSGSFDLVSDRVGGWVAPREGFLAVDRDGSGSIDNLAEIAFVEEDPRARTDLEGLAYGFDSNGDGVVSDQDDRFGELKVFQDTNGNRQSDSGELMSLEEAGITSIDVSNVPYDGQPEVVEEIDGNKIFGQTEVTFGDGSTTIAGDVALTLDGSLEADVARMQSSMASFDNNQADGVMQRDEHHRDKGSTPVLAGSSMAA